MFDPFFALLFLAAVIVPIVAFIYWANPRRRSKGRAGCLIPLSCAIGAFSAFLYYAGPELFVSNQGAAEIYIVAPEQKADRFIEVLARAAGRYGVKSYISRTTDNGSVTHTLAGNGNWLNIFSTNMPLDPDGCGRHSAFGSDPGQYILRISRILPFGTEHSAHELAAKIRNDLTATGYDVRNKAIECSPLEKSRVPR